MSQKHGKKRKGYFKNPSTTATTATNKVVLKMPSTKSDFSQQNWEKLKKLEEEVKTQKGKKQNYHNNSKKRKITDSSETTDKKLKMSSESIKINRNKFGFYAYTHYGDLLTPIPKEDLKKNVTSVTQLLALDCEMVGTGPTGEENLLARVSIVNEFGYCVLNRFIKPRIKVADYRTEFSGIKEGDLDNGHEYEDVIKEVTEIIKDKTIIGHSLKNDIKVLRITHSKNRIRDTAKYFKNQLGFLPSLKKLCEDYLNVKIQNDDGTGHSSIEDAQACMKIYLKFRKEWEQSIRNLQFQGKKLGK